MSVKISAELRRKIFLTVSIFVLIFGYVIYPAVPLIYGMILLYLLWSETGGMSYGNPYKKKMMEEGRPPLTKAAYSPINVSYQPEETSDIVYILIAALGFFNIIYGLVLFYWMYG